MVRFLVVGETCIDRFIYCDVNRLSPEAPVPVLLPIEINENKGMSGNVVENLISLGVMLTDITHWHQDILITKTRYVDKKSNHMFVRIDEKEEFVRKLDNIDDSQKFDVVIVSDYNKGFLSDKSLKELSKLGKISILDSKRKLKKDIVDSFTFVKLNEQESISNIDLVDSNNLLITLGSRGTKYQNTIYSSPNPQETIDVSGAGDTFTASFILNYYKTNDIESSIVFANKMSSIVVSKRGVATP